METNPAPAAPALFSRQFAGLGGDLRFALRMLVKNKAFAATALVTLALCIGANTAIFSALYGLVIKPLPFGEPQRMVEIYNSFPKNGLNRMPSNVVQYLDFKQNADAFAGLGLWQGWECTLGEDAGPVRVRAVMATSSMFDVLGLQPVLGAFFKAENSVPGAERVIVLTQSFWETQYQGDPAVLERTMRIDGDTYTIVGVAPRVFEAFDARVKFIRPLAWPPDRVNPQARYGVSPQLYGRLKPGATLAQARTQVEALERAFYDQAPPQLRGFLDRSGHVIGVDTVQEQRVLPLRTKLFVLQGGALFVLLIGCVNVANLLLARSNARQGELSIRVALGAGRGAIARQLLLESASLCAVGTVLGLGVAWGAIKVMNRFSAQMMPNALPFAFDGRVLAYTALIAAAMALLIGMLPVVHVLRANLLARLQGQSRGASGGRGVRVTSSVLVVAQMAVALVLLTGAGLLIRSFAHALAIDPGLDPRQVIVARVALPPEYRRENRVWGFQEQLLTAVREIPGVTSVSLATATPFASRSLPINALVLRNVELADNDEQPGAYHLGASPEFLETLRIPLREGRWFLPSDTEQSRPRAMVVDEAFARKFFPGRSAVGGHFTFGGPPQREEDWPEIVGVVGEVRHLGIEAPSPNPFIYYPMRQNQFTDFTLFVRSTRPAVDTIADLRTRVRTLDPALPLYRIDTMENVVGNSFNERRVLMLLLVAFAGLALVLSAVGIYGVLAYDVSQRTREIGIRGAIGATRGQVVALVVRQGLWKTGVGLALGVGASLWLSRYMTTLLFEMPAIDPLAYGAVALLLLAVGMLASYLPARRAARIDPIVALRSE